MIKNYGMIASYVATMHGSLSRQETYVATEVLLLIL